MAVNMLQLPIPLPSVAEQNAIAEVLTDMDAEIAALGAASRQGPRPQARHDAGTTHRENATRMKISTIVDHVDSRHMALPSSNGDMFGIATKSGGCSIRFTAVTQ